MNNPSRVQDTRCVATSSEGKAVVSGRDPDPVSAVAGEAPEQWGAWGGAGTPGLCGARARDSAHKDGMSEWTRSKRLFE